jgi:hypothetical protein
MHYQYYNSNALLIINAKGKIKILYTPFRVICISEQANLKKGVNVYVEEVLHDKTDKLYFLIGSNKYLQSCFLIIISF